LGLAVQGLSGPAVPFVGVLRPGGFLTVGGWSHLWTTRRSCRRHRRLEQVAQADQVVGDHVQPEHHTHLASAAGHQSWGWMRSICFLQLFPWHQGGEDDPMVVRDQRAAKRHMKLFD